LIGAVLLAAAMFWQPPPRTIAITVDDLPTVSVVGETIETSERVTQQLVATLERHKVPAIGFVNERKLQTSGAVDPRRLALLERWLDAGLDLGNHTYSHPDLHRTPLDTVMRDVLLGEQVTRRLLAARNRRPEYFRHPFLHTGRSLEMKRSLEHSWVSMAIGWPVERRYVRCAGGDAAVARVSIRVAFGGPEG